MDDAAYGGNFHLVEKAYKDGFEFGGWYDNAEFTGAAYTALDKNVKTYYANWNGPVAKIGDVPYNSLMTAFAEAKEGDTITLLDDATPAFTSQRAITKASVIDLNGHTLKLIEDDLYFGTTTFKNGNIVVSHLVKPSTAVFWMFANQTLTFDNVKLTASGVSGTYLIGLDGDNADLNLLNGSEIIVENDTALDLDIICVNASIGNDIVVDNSKVSVTNLDGRVFFRGNYTISGNSDIDMIGITKAGIRIEAGQSLNVVDTARDGGIHITNLPATYFKADTATVNATWNIPASTAKIGEKHYYKLQDAVDDAKAGDVVKLLKNVTESVVANAPAANNAARSTATGVTIDLNKFTLTGDITVNSDATVTIKNGTIVNTSTEKHAIDSKGKLTVEDVDITSSMHAVRIRGGEATINGGNYITTGAADSTTYAVLASGKSLVTIANGVFTGPANTVADSGSAVGAQGEGTKIVINGGKFSGGYIYTLLEIDNGEIEVAGGMFDQDPAAYIAPTSEAIDRGAYEYPYGVAPKAAAKINVTLEETSNKNVYDIVINSDGAYDIYEFVSAELTFANNSTTVGGSYMHYEIRGYATNKTFAQEAKDAVNLKDNEEQYIISLVDGAKRLSGDGIIIGQVEFFGQGTLDFSITKGKVATTWQNTNLGRYYDAAAGTLVIEDAEINDNIPEVHRNVAVNVAFNHNIYNDKQDKSWDNYQITATLKNNAMNWSKELDVTIEDIKSGACVFENVPVGYITVTLKAPGFRTYTYETTLEETKDNGVLVLNFWNDVKDGNDEAIEKGKATMAHNFVVGDIVMDMKVDKYDLAAVTSYYGTYNIENNAKYLRYDLNRDGHIDIRDVQYVLHTMGN